MIQWLKTIYSELRAITRAIFAYPKRTLRLAEDFDYDEYWRQKRGDRLGSLSSWQRARADIIKAQIQKEGGTSVGDIGCGDGSILKYLKESLPTITTLRGYDTSPAALEIAKGFGIETHNINLSTEGWESVLQSSDYLLLLETIEHVAHSEEVVAKALEHVTKGVFISVPNSGYFTYRLRLLFGKFPSQWLTFPNEHLRFWTAADMKWWLRALGYTNAKHYLYKGIPVLNTVWPALFAAGQIAYIPKR